MHFIYQSERFKIKKYRYHLVGWLCFLFYEIVISGLISGHFASISNYVLHYSLNISLFYFHAHVVLPIALKNKSNYAWIIPFSCLFEASAYLVVTYLVEVIGVKFANLDLGIPMNFSYNYIIIGLWRFVYITGFSTAYYFLLNSIKERQSRENLEKEKLINIIEKQQIEKDLYKAKTDYLRTQINPHFLFNTLNYIYNKTRKVAPLASEAIITLSEMMRYALESGDNIILEQEIEQVKKLIYLHKLRNHTDIYINVEQSDQALNIKIIPLILLTLVENIFKHGDLQQIEHIAYIKIILNGDTLTIETDNLINMNQNYFGTNTGLKNIESRLKYAYGNSASLEYYCTSDNHFMVNLKIRDCYSDNHDLL